MKTVEDILNIRANICGARPPWLTPRTRANVRQQRICAAPACAVLGPLGTIGFANRRIFLNVRRHGDEEIFPYGMTGIMILFMLN